MGSRTTSKNNASSMTLKLRPSKKSKLTAKRKRFCREWIIDRNGTQAAVRSGYSEKTANEQAAQLLADTSVQKEIARLEAAQNKRLDITADKVKAEIAKIAFVDIIDLVEKFDGKKLVFKSLDEIPDHVRGAIKSIKTKRAAAIKKLIEYEDEVIVELWSKERALEMLAKHFNLYEGHQEAGAPKVETLSDDELFEKIEAHYKTLKAKRGAK